MEAELKLRLPSQATYDAALLECGVTDGGRRRLVQQNEFFDTPAGSLAACDCHLRLRLEVEHDRVESEAAARWVVTAKGAKRKGGKLAVRPEEEVIISEAEAEACRRGTASPLDCLPPSELVSQLRAAQGASELTRTDDSFENSRVRAPLELETSAGAVPVTLEFDRTTFRWRASSEVQWEVECELPAADAEALAEPVEAALQRILRKACGAACPVAQGKKRRLHQFRERAMAAAAEASGGPAPGTMLQFAGQPDFEAWLQRCPLPADALSYGVTRSPAGLAIECRWQLSPARPAEARSAAAPPSAVAMPSSPPAAPAGRGRPAAASSTPAASTIDAVRAALASPPMGAPPPPHEGVGETLTKVQAAIERVSTPQPPSAAPSLPIWDYDGSAHLGGAGTSQATIEAVRAALARVPIAVPPTVLEGEPVQEMPVLTGLTGGDGEGRQNPGQPAGYRWADSLP